MTFVCRIAATEYLGILTWEEVVEHSKAKPLLLFYSFIVVDEALPEMVTFVDREGLGFGELYSNSFDVKRHLKKKNIWFSGCWIVEGGEVVDYEKRKGGLLANAREAHISCVKDCVARYKAKGLPDPSPPRPRVFEGVNPDCGKDPTYATRERLTWVIRELSDTEIQKTSGRWGELYRLAEFWKLVGDLCARGSVTDVHTLIDALQLVEMTRSRLARRDRGELTGVVQELYKWEKQIGDSLYRITGRPKGWFTSGTSGAWLKWWQEQKEQKKK
jgi:hypothetical protein